MGWLRGAALRRRVAMVDAAAAAAEAFRNVLRDEMPIDDFLLWKSALDDESEVRFISSELIGSS
jgi:hypothetical protein